MALRIVEARADHVPAIRALNARLREGGTDWGFYERAEADWLAPVTDNPVWRRHYLVEDDTTGTVHGGYVLKQQPFLLDGVPLLIGNVQGPVSEGLVNRRFALLGPMMLRDSLARLPLQFGWGTSERKAALLVRSGWVERRIPLLLDVIAPAVVLRAQAEAGAARAPLLRWAAASGAASLAASAGRAGSILALGTDRTAIAEPVDRFSPWADTLWPAAAGRALQAVRDAVAMDRLFPAGSWPALRHYRVCRNGKPIGLGLLRCQSLAGHKRFGSLTAATLVDALAFPGEERAVARALGEAVRETGAHLAVACFTHPAWVGAFKAAGWFATPPRRRLLLSPALVTRMGGRALDPAAIHLSLADGDGPRFF